MSSTATMLLTSKRPQETESALTPYVQKVLYVQYADEWDDLLENEYGENWKAVLEAKYEQPINEVVVEEVERLEVIKLGQTQVETKKNQLVESLGAHWEDVLEVEYGDDWEFVVHSLKGDVSFETLNAEVEALVVKNEAYQAVLDGTTPKETITTFNQKFDIPESVKAEFDVMYGENWKSHLEKKYGQNWEYAMTQAYGGEFESQLVLELEALKKQETPDSSGAQAVIEVQTTPTVPEPTPTTTPTVPEPTPTTTPTVT